MHPNLPEWGKLNYRQTVVFYAEMLAKAGDDKSKLRRTMRELGENDLFYLFAYILNGPDIFHPWLFARCREVQSSPNGHLDLWARAHFKSSIITFAQTIKDIINDQEITIGIFSFNNKTAKGFLRQIKFEMETNLLLHELWPEIFWEDPKKQAPVWSEESGLIVKRSGNPKEATVEASGLVDGMPTGKHYKLRVYDDVVTPESVTTPDQIHKTTTAFQLSDNLGTDGGWERYIGTRYAMFDTYRTMMDEDIAIPRIHTATSNGTLTGEPVLLSKEALDDKRKKQGSYVFSCQMLQNPVADSAMGFDRNWLVYQDTEKSTAMRTLWRFIIVDPAGGKQRKNNDFTTMWVIGYGEDGKYRVLDIVRDRLRLTQRWDALVALHKEWQPHLVVYEEYGMQADIEHMKEMMKLKVYEFEITPIGGSMKKETRILRLVPYFENGYDELENTPKSKIILPTSCKKIDYQGHSKDLVKSFVEEEYVPFPVLSHDDMIDGLARIPDLEEKGLIEKPMITPIKNTTNKIQQRLKNSMGGGENSWLTV